MVYEAIKQIINYYGVKRQLPILAEECAELAKVALKYHRYYEDYESTRAANKDEKKHLIENFKEEIADVYIMCNQMMYKLHITEDELLEIMEEKTDRQLFRIKMEKNKI